jgi:hypothetical protein
MYEILLVVHNLMRWAVLIAGLLAFARALRGSMSDVAWSTDDRRTSAIFTGTVHLQLLLGLALYAISPITRAAMGDMAVAMRDPATRNIAVEHPAMMILAVILATAAGPVARRAATDRGRFRRLALLVGLALVAIVAGIPWGRPLVRGL